MRIEIVQHASGPNGEDRFQRAVLLIDGNKWFSSIPDGAGEAQTFNLYAAALVELANRHQ